MISTPYQKLVEACPLCESMRFIRFKEGDAQGHKLYQPWMLPTILWVACVGCGHVFNRHCFTEEGFEKLFEKPALDSECPSTRPPRDRLVMGRFIERAWPYIDHPTSPSDSVWMRWLDVGFGNGALVATAAEYGYNAMGIDTRKNAVDEMRGQGYDVLHTSLVDFKPSPSDRTFHVVTMLDVLEHIPDPVAAIRHVERYLLATRGVLIVSTPNMDSDDWKRGAADAYWREVEHLHNFTRARLMGLLRVEGFDILRYHTSERYIGGMEIVCRKGR